MIGSARLFSLCSSVVNRNEWAVTSSRYACTIGAKNKGVKFFLNFFFVGCGCSGVGARVWVLGCGCVGVCGCVGRRDRDGAGWMEAGTGCGGLDWDCRCRMGENRLPGLPYPGFGWKARV